MGGVEPGLEPGVDLGVARADGLAETDRCLCTLGLGHGDTPGDEYAELRLVFLLQYTTALLEVSTVPSYNGLISETLNKCFCFETSFFRSVNIIHVYCQDLWIELVLGCRFAKQNMYTQHLYFIEKLLRQCFDGAIHNSVTMV